MAKLEYRVVGTPKDSQQTSTKFAVNFEAAIAAFRARRAEGYTFVTVARCDGTPLTEAQELSLSLATEQVPTMPRVDYSVSGVPKYGCHYVVLTTDDFDYALIRANELRAAGWFSVIIARDDGQPLTPEQLAALSPAPASPNEAVKPSVPKFIQVSAAPCPTMGSIIVALDEAGVVWQYNKSTEVWYPCADTRHNPSMEPAHAPRPA